MRSMAAVLVLVVAAAACAGGPGASVPVGPSSGPAQLTLMTHDSFALSDATIQRFETMHGVTLRILRSGDAGAMVNQAILSREHPLADVLYGVDDTFLSRALDAGLFEPYEPAGSSAVPARFQLDASRRVTPIDYGDVCLNVDLDAFSSGDPPAPETLDDLTDPAYRGSLVVEDPAISSPGLAFLLATIARYGDVGETTWRDYWVSLRDNDVSVADGWEDAYYERFSGGAGRGDRPLVVSYASSPAAEVAFSDPPADTPSTAAVLDGCYRQIEFAGVLAGTEARDLARAFIDFLLSKEVQEEIPLQMFVYPVRSDAVLPDLFQDHAQVAPDPLTLPYETIGRDRQRWVEEWSDIVLR